MTTNPALERELVTHNYLRDRLRAEFPEADDETLQDTLEGLTNLQDQLAELVRSALDDEALVEALRRRTADMRDRAARLAHRAEVKREIVGETMDRAGIPRMVHPDLTVTLRPSQPGLLVTDEAAIPEPYWRPQPARLDRQALLQAIKGGTSVAGAALRNGPATIAVRTK